jgi:hypothetical protein
MSAPMIFWIVFTAVGVGISIATAIVATRRAK